MLASSNHRGVVLGILLALTACASNKSPMVATTDMDLRKKEIQDLWIQIRDWRVDHQWSAEPTAGMRVPGLLKDIRRCKEPREPSTDVCQDICTLKDAICDNAQSICRIAGDLSGDSWADEKCKSAKASCQEATEKCCECTAAEPPSTGPPADGG
jgi:hypothetical protein